MTDKEYREDERLNYSTISNFDKIGIKIFKEKEDEGYKDYFAFGDAVETKVMSGNEEFIKNFVISDLNKPTASLGILADAILKNNVPLKEDSVVTLAKMLNLWKRTKDPDIYRATAFNKELKNYIKLQRSNKTFISTPDYLLANSCVNGLETSKYTKDIFANKNAI